MQCVGQAFGAFGLFPGELHDYIIRVQAGFSCRRIVVDSGNLDALIRCQMKILSLLLGHVFEIDAKVSAMMMKLLMPTIGRKDACRPRLAEPAAQGRQDSMETIDVS